MGLLLLRVVVLLLVLVKVVLVIASPRSFRGSSSLRWKSPILHPRLLAVEHRSVDSWVACVGPTCRADGDLGISAVPLYS
eukprot:5797301-Pleurochrysis_carterae.AAC.1